MKVARFLSLVVVASLLATVATRAESSGGDAESIRELIEASYVRGVFVGRDPELVRVGFHPEFVMPVLVDGNLIVAPLEMWLERLGLDGVPSEQAVEHTVELVDVTHDAAIAKVRISIDGELRYTDYFALHRLEAGWKIVTKIFASHD